MSRSTARFKIAQVAPSSQHSAHQNEIGKNIVTKERDLVSFKNGTQF